MRGLSLIAGSALLVTSGCAANGPSTQASATPNAAVSPGPSPADLAAFDAMTQAMPDGRALKATVMEAYRRHDFRAAIAMEQVWAKRHPDDLAVREDEPMLYKAAGDVAGWDHARDDLIATWSRIPDSRKQTMRPGFAIDIFKAGDKTVVAQQCYERAGRFGVLYRFDVIGQDLKLLSFFTVESPDSDNQVAREMGRKSPVFFLDHNRPGFHETVDKMDQLPAYPTLRQRVVDYMATPTPKSSSTHPGLVSYGCEVAHAAPRL